jgi:hypothetical protein
MRSIMCSVTVHASLATPASAAYLTNVKVKIYIFIWENPMGRTFILPQWQDDDDNW